MDDKFEKPLHSSKQFPPRRQFQGVLFPYDANWHKLALHVEREQYEETRAIVDKAPGLILKKGTIEDCFGRTFSNLSPLQYTLWNPSPPMWEIFFKCISRHEQEREILVAWLAQYNEIKKQGVTYVLNEEIVTERSFDLQPIIDALQTQIDALNNRESVEPTAQQWRQGVGGAQEKLTMRAIHKYGQPAAVPLKKFAYSPVIAGEDEIYLLEKALHLDLDENHHFYMLDEDWDTPSGDDVAFIPKSVLVRPEPKPAPPPKPPTIFYNNKTKKEGDWLDKNSGLGKDFALCSTGDELQALEQIYAPFKHILYRNLTSMENLAKENLEAFVGLEAQIQERIAALDNQCQLNPIVAG